MSYRHDERAPWWSPHAAAEPHQSPPVDRLGRPPLPPASTSRSDRDAELKDLRREVKESKAREAAAAARVANCETSLAKIQKELQATESDGTEYAKLENLFRDSFRRSVVAKLSAAGLTEKRNFMDPDKSADELGLQHALVGTVEFAEVAEVMFPHLAEKMTDHRRPATKHEAAALVVLSSDAVDCIRWPDLCMDVDVDKPHQIQAGQLEKLGQLAKATRLAQFVAICGRSTEFARKFAARAKELDRVVQRAKADAHQYALHKSAHCRMRCLEGDVASLREATLSNLVSGEPKAAADTTKAETFVPYTGVPRRVGDSVEYPEDGSVGRPHKRCKVAPVAKYCQSCGETFQNMSDADYFCPNCVHNEKLEPVHGVCNTCGAALIGRFCTKQECRTTMR